jgi:hypothetical protein
MPNPLFQTLSTTAVIFFDQYYDMTGTKEFDQLSSRIRPTCLTVYLVSSLFSLFVSEQRSTEGSKTPGASARAGRCFGSSPLRRCVVRRPVCGVLLCCCAAACITCCYLASTTHQNKKHDVQLPCTKVATTTSQRRLGAAHRQLPPPAAAFPATPSTAS